MEILVLSSSFPRHPGDAAGRFVLDTSRGLTERGHRTVHLVPAARRTEELDLPNGMTVHRVPIGRRNWGGALAYGAGMGANLRRSPWLLPAVPTMLASFRRAAEEQLAGMDEPVVLSHWAFPAGLVGAGLARDRGLTHVSVVHGGGLQALLRSRLTRGLVRKWAKYSHGVLYVSEDLRRRADQALGADAPQRTVVRPMGIDPERFEGEGLGPFRRQLGVTSATPVLAGVGRLIGLKGFDLLLRAAAAMNDAAVVLAGDGPERAALQRLAEESGVPTLFTGVLGPRELGELYRTSTLLVVPSRLGPGGRSEGSPMVVLEALSQGLPFVASATGGLSDLAHQSGAGLIVSTNDPHSLSRTITDICSDPARQLSMKNKGLQFASAHTYSETAGSLETLFLDRHCR